jgi:hypothetical protein
MHNAVPNEPTIWLYAESVESSLLFVQILKINLNIILRSVTLILMYFVDVSFLCTRKVKGYLFKNGYSIPE